MKKLFLILLCVMFLAPARAQGSKDDTALIKNTVMGFYEWYVQHHAKLNSFELYQGIHRREEPPYRINWPEVDRYFDFIRHSVPWLGEAFIRQQKAFFVECDSVFKTDPEGEIPYGFDFDWYTNSQEDPGWLLDELKRATRWKISVNGDEAQADVMGMYNDNGNQVEAVILCYTMKKEKGKWRIARISCPYSKYESS